MVAKLYNKLQSRERCDKLRAMAKLCSPDLLKNRSLADSHALNAGNPAAIDGILMPRIADFLEIHHLYSVAQERRIFPKPIGGSCSTRRGIVRLPSSRSTPMAMSWAALTKQLSGRASSRWSTATRFRSPKNPRIFRCGVGVPEYPARVARKSFATLDRTANHDLFGLAILVFHLVMMGRHPFSRSAASSSGHTDREGHRRRLLRRYLCTASARLKLRRVRGDHARSAHA